MKILSLFDGISCGRVALERAGIPIEKYIAYENNKYAMSIARYNYPQLIEKGDVQYADFTEYKGFDIVMAGSPCTFWSIAKHNREEDKNGQGWKLFIRVVDAIKIIKPKYFIYENVASMPLKIKNYITEELGVEPIMINSSLVSAQNRKRLYWTNIKVSAQPHDKQIFLKDILEPDIDCQNKYPKIYQKPRGYNKGGLKKGKAPTMNASCYQENNLVCFNINLSGRGMNGEVIGDDNYFIRKLSAIECERLQTLPDDYTKFGRVCKKILKISDAQRYRCIGNAWTVDVITHVLKHVSHPVEV